MYLEFAEYFVKNLEVIFDFCDVSDFENYVCVVRYRVELEFSFIVFLFQLYKFLIEIILIFFLLYVINYVIFKYLINMGFV